MFDFGDIVPLAVQIRDEQGNPANAGNVSLVIERPDGMLITQEAVPASETVGRYEYDYAPTLPGRHRVRWTSTGLNSAAYTDIFDVRPEFPAALISLEQARQHIGLTSSVDDEELREFVESATAAVEDLRGEAVARRTFVEVVDLARPTWHLALGHSPVISLGLVESANGVLVWNPLNLGLDPDGILHIRYGPALNGPIRITYVAGYEQIPVNFQLATKIIVKHLWQTQQQPTGGGGPRGPFGGEEEFAMVQTSLGFAVPNRAAQLLGGGRGPLVA